MASGAAANLNYGNFQESNYFNTQVSTPTESIKPSFTSFQNQALMQLDFLLDGVYEFRSSFLHILLDENSHLMYSEWINMPSSEEYQKGVAILASLIQDLHVEFWIQDATNLADMPLSEQKIAIAMMGKRVANSELKKIARVSIHDTNIKEVLEKANRSITKFNATYEVQHFKTYREAAHWIGAE